MLTHIILLSLLNKAIDWLFVWKIDYWMIWLIRVWSRYSTVDRGQGLLYNLRCSGHTIDPNYAQSGGRGCHGASGWCNGSRGEATEGGVLLLTRLPPVARAKCRGAARLAHLLCASGRLLQPGTRVVLPRRLLLLFHLYRHHRPWRLHPWLLPQPAACRFLQGLHRG